jgi:Flp pilus assembly protein TadG
MRTFLGKTFRGRRRLSGERGGSAVEAALVTPVVMAMIFGIIESGFVFKDYLAVGGAVRSGARVASAAPRNAAFAQKTADKVASTGGAMNLLDVQEMWVYKVGSTVGSATDKPCVAGTVAANTPCTARTDFGDCSVCVKFTWDTGTNAFVPIVGGGGPTWASNTQNACTLGPPDRIGVYMKLRHNPFTGFVFQTIYISEASILTLEPLPVASVCK